MEGVLQALTAITNAIPTQTSLTNAPLRARCDTKQVIIPSAHRDPPASTTSHAETADRDEKRFSDGSASSTLFVALVAVVAGIGGTIVALHYHELGLTLSHYDARGHLVVARRIIDSLTPGWQQIGAVWLPLPHLLNALPVQVDAWYRSGASAVAISIAAFAVAVGAIAWIVLELTGSQVAAVAGAAVFAFNPNVLYLQSTPMTEPLLLGADDAGGGDAGRLVHD